MSSVQVTALELVGEYGRFWMSQMIRLCPPQRAHKHGTAVCVQRGKVPLDRRWQSIPQQRAAAEVSAERVAEELAAHLQQGGNVGLAVPSGVVALDADEERSAALLAAVCPDAPLQRTARGVHVVLSLEGKPDVTNTRQLALGDDCYVDVRGHGAQIVVWPSVHSSGAVYVWERALPYFPADLVPVPERWRSALSTHPQRRSSNDWVSLARRAVREGERHNTMISLVGKLLAPDVPPRELVEELVQVWNAARCRPPLPHEEVSRAVNDLADRELANGLGRDSFESAVAFGTDWGASW